MPLHLLPKKSWNVYNADNIARVRRDEAAAKAKEEAEEQRMQEYDAKRRLAILRGEIPPPYEGADEAAQVVEETLGDTKSTGDKLGYKEKRKHRKRPGEDDTEFELRLARERAAGGDEPSFALASSLSRSKPSSSAPIVGQDGHIDLIGDDKAYQYSRKNLDAEKEAAAAQRRKEYEDQFSMRLANAAGKDGLGNPWYVTSAAKVEVETPSRNAWGNEDPLRKQRDAARLVSSDPLAMMKMGAAKVREVKKARQMAQQEREEELRALKREERHREKRARRRREDEDGERRRRSRDRSREERRRRERSRERDSDSRRRKRSRSPEKERRRDGRERERRDDESRRGEQRRRDERR